MSKTPEYRSWYAMKRRCENGNDAEFDNYGGRGIAVCDRWQVFENFVEDMGNRPSPQHTVDRINSNGNYEPANCRWAKAEEQSNNKRNNRTLTYHGITQTLAQWGKHTGIAPVTIGSRLSRGWSVEQALTTPVRKYNEV